METETEMVVIDDKQLHYLRGIRLILVYLALIFTASIIATAVTPGGPF